MLQARSTFQALWGAEEALNVASSSPRASKEVNTALFGKVNDLPKVTQFFSGDGGGNLDTLAPIVNS